jgi:hypothetical protein
MLRLIIEACPKNDFEKIHKRMLIDIAQPMKTKIRKLSKKNLQ